MKQCAPLLSYTLDGGRSNARNLKFKDFTPWAHHRRQACVVSHGPLLERPFSPGRLLASKRDHHALPGHAALNPKP